jgi:regulator of protease activity HflC (stomatin/prohibitin superfamily)
MLKIIRPYEKGLAERLGLYKRTFNSGLAIYRPFIERVIKVDMREQVVDVPPQAVITKDNVAVEVDAVIYYQVFDPVKVTYEVADFYSAATKLAQTSLRNLIGDLALDESLTSRELINAKLLKILDQATDKWGVRVTMVELQRIEPPKDVTEAMHRQMKAERDKRARILTSEGQKQADVLEAEGRKQAAILEAEGLREAKILEAQAEAEAIVKVAEAEKFRERTIALGEAEAIDSVFAAIHKSNPTQELIALKYLETLSAMADGKATKMFLPYEASGILSSLAGISEIMKDGASLQGQKQMTQSDSADNDSDFGGVHSDGDGASRKRGLK